MNSTQLAVVLVKWQCAMPRGAPAWLSTGRLSQRLTAQHGNSFQQHHSLTAYISTASMASTNVLQQVLAQLCGLQHHSSTTASKR